METMLLIAVVTIVLAIGVVIFIKFSTPVQDQVVLNTAENSLRAIINEAEQIHSFSEGTRNSVTIRVPQRVKSITFSGYEAYMTLEASAGDGLTVDVPLASNVPFFEQTFTDPPEGNFELLIGSKRSGNDLGICVVEFGGTLDCTVLNLN